MDDVCGDPCFHCAVRADLGCAHQPAHGGTPPALRRGKRKVDRREYRGQGYNFGKGERSRELQQAMQRLKAARR